MFQKTKRFIAFIMILFVFITHISPSMTVSANDSDSSVMERIALAEELGLEAFIDEEGYLLDAYFKGKSDKDLEGIGIEPLIRTITEEELDAYVANLNAGIAMYTVTDYQKVSDTSPAGYTSTTGVYEVDGILAFCIQSSAVWPEKGDPTSAPIAVTNTNLRKALYYGYNGPADLGKYSYVATHCAAATANGDGNNWGEDILEELRSYDAPPSNFKVWKVETNGGSTQDLAYYTIEQKGAIKATKSSACPELTNGNSCYSLDGAQYGVYSDSALSSKVGTLTFNASGNSNTLEVDAGTYYVKETKAPKGYQLSSEKTKVVVTAGKTATVNLTDLPQNDPAAISITKINPDGEDLTGIPSLAGTQFTVKYYAGYYTKDSLPSKATKTWVIQTKETVVGGKTYYLTGLAETYKVSGDSFYYLEGNSNPVLPLGTISIEETKAAPGYTLDGGYLQVSGSSTKFSGKYVAQITSSNSSASLSGGNAFTGTNYLMYGGIEVQKQDAVTGAKAQGEATLQGAKFVIRNATGNSVKVNGKIYANGEVVTTLTTDAKGYAATAKDLLPYGKYEVEEITAPTGYQLSGSNIKQTVNVNKGNTLITAGVTKDRVIRGGVLIEKWDVDSNKNAALGGATLEGAKFQIISLNDQVVVVNGKEYQKNAVICTLSTDKNGKVQTAADFLPYGTYKIVEVSAPVGYNHTGVLERTFAIRENGKVVSMNTSDTAIKNDVIRGDLQLVKFRESEDEKQDQKEALEGIIFRLTSKTTGESVEIVTDKNGYASTKQLNLHNRGNLVYDTYVVHEVNTPAGLEPVKDFEISIRNEGETLYYILEDKIIIAPVRLVKVDAETGKVLPFANTEFELLDANKNPIELTTHYPNEVVHKTFKTDESGTFTLPEKLPYGVYYFRELNVPEGYVLATEDLKFEITETHDWENPMVVTFGNMPAKGKIEVLKKDAETGEVLSGSVFEIIAMEDIYTPDGTLRASKGEIVDTITTGSDGKAESKELYLGKYQVSEKKPAPGYVLSEKVFEVELLYKDQYTALVSEGVELENKPTHVQIQKTEEETGKELSGVTFKVWNQDTETEEAAKEYVTDEKGLIDIKRLVPGKYSVKEVSTLPGYILNETVFTFVIDENGYIDGEVIGVIKVTNIATKLVGTTAKSQDTNTQEAIPKKETVLIDTVEFKNLQVGEEYTIKGVLMDKATGKPLLIDGKEVTAEKTFVATEKDGTVDVIFTFDGSGLKGKSVVVFEKVYIDGVEILAHEDLNDQGQTIEFPDSQIQTTAKEQETGGQVVAPKETITIVDTVKYENLIVGQTYTMKGILMSKSTGKPLLVNGKEVTAEITFVPTEKNGTVELSFTFDASALKGQSVVVFESLYVQETEVAVHQDINDGGQTVTFKNAPKTGDFTNITVYMTMTVVSFLVVVFFSKKRLVKVNK